MSTQQLSRLEPYLWAIASGLLMALAWFNPGTGLGALLGWLATLGLVAASLHPRASYRSLYLVGAIQTSLGFFWILETIQKFGGFPLWAAAAIFALFVAISSLQNAVYFFVFKNLPAFLDRTSSRAALAWITSEVLSIRIFPWYIGHTQLGFSWFAQSADLASVLGLSFLMVWFCEAVFRSAIRREGTRRLIPALLVSLLALLYGKLRWDEFAYPLGTPLDVTLVQANVTTENKANLHFFAENRARYQSLTERLPPGPELVIWPESVIQDFIPEGVARAERDARVPRFKGKHLLTGALTFRSRREFFNSALAVFHDGTVPTPYHKQILMPFGEYMPLSSLFPSLLDLNPAAGNFSAGTEIAVVEYPELLPSTPRPFKVAPLICYEDVVPSLSRDAVRKGAELIVNLTNDAWFGDTIAPYQHHLIASFRAIETRRFLLRSTNSGLTAIVSPRGVTLESLPTFGEGTISGRVKLMNAPTPYVRAVGELPWWILSLLSLVTSLAIHFERRRTSRRGAKPASARPPPA
jgi:apolipoprotein N-acyltransferase